MPRDSNGVYTLPPGNPVVPNTLIEADWANQTMEDVADAMTGSLPRDGSAPMLAQLILPSVAPTNSRAAVPKSYVDQLVGFSSGLPIGSVIPFAGGSGPSGFLLCNGQSVSRITYSALFAVIGTIYGAGDGSTTFNVPDMRAQFVRGVYDGRTLGSKQDGSFAAHTHAVSDTGHTHTSNDPGHSHTQTAHSHTISDPGHSHDISTYNGGTAVLNHAKASDQTGANGGAETGQDTTGITIQSAQPAIQANTTGVSLDPAYTGISLGVAGGTETVPQNIAYNYYIKAVQDGTLSTVTAIQSSDSNVLAVDETNPAVPVLTPKTNVPFGMLKLDQNAKVPLANSSSGIQTFLGLFDASGGNNPSQEFPTTTFVNGDTYIVGVAGTINVYNPDTNTAAPTLVEVGYNLIYLASPAVQPTGWYYTVASASGIAAASVLFAPSGSISASNVQAAIQELDAETLKGPLTAANVANVPTGTISSTNVQGAINELEAEKAPASAGSASGTTFTPTAGIAATDVQGAIAELEADVSSALAAKAPSNGAVLSSPTVNSPNFNNTPLSNIKTATFAGVGVAAAASGAVTIDWATAQNFRQPEPTGAITYTFSPPPGVCHLQLFIDSDGTSTAYPPTWPASVIWYGAVWQPVANKKAFINMWYDGTNYHATGMNQA